jgi:hypothetical protein
MILHDFRCVECRHTEEHFVSSDTQSVACERCGGHAGKIFLELAKPHWAALAQGDNASPEAINRFERIHKQQTAKENKSYKEHGDYGPAPGGQGGVRNMDGS